MSKIDFNKSKNATQEFLLSLCGVKITVLKASRDKFSQQQQAKQNPLFSQSNHGDDE